MPPPISEHVSVVQMTLVARPGELKVKAVKIVSLCGPPWTMGDHRWGGVE